MKKLIPVITFFIVISMIHKNFGMDKNRMFDECITKCEADMNDFTKRYQHECKEGFLNRIRCFKNGIQAIRKFDACSNKCFKEFDATNNEVNK